MVVHVKPHEVFQRNDSDLLIEVPIGFAQATLGAEIEVPTIDSKAKLVIPSGTQTHTIFRLRGKGLPRLNRFGKGNELVKVIVKTPTKLTSRQRQLFMELAKEQGKYHSPKLVISDKTIPLYNPPRTAGRNLSRTIKGNPFMFLDSISRLLLST